MTTATETIEATREPIVGIWDDAERDLFTRYRVTITFVGKVMGGVPQKPELIESWLRQRILGGDEELRITLLKTLEDLEIEVPADASREEIIEAAKKIAATRNGNTFRRDDQGLFLADYQIKAAMKEATAIVFPGGQSKEANKWGVTRKAPRSFLAERVFIDEERIHLGRSEPDGTHMQVGHVTGPQGPRSTLTYYDYCERPECSFTVSSLQDAIKPEHWRDILLAAQRLGIGAMRSMSYGQFKITGFDRIDTPRAHHDVTRSGRKEVASSAFDAIKPGVSDKHPAGQPATTERSAA
jgi:hypothetical protein